MPATLTPQVRDDLIKRIDRLRPDAERRWGRMTAPQMICHLSDQLRLALGRLDARAQRGAVRWPPLKQLVIYVVPWPKGKIDGPTESRTTEPTAWESDTTTLRSLLEEFAARDATEPWSPHPLFGAMSGRLWSAFTRRHFDHHLRQFGV